MIHTLISTSVAPGGGRSGLPASSGFPLTVELVTPAPEPPASAPEPELRPATPAQPAKKIAQKPAAGSPEALPRTDSIGLAHIPDPTYYGARQLDVYPVLAGALRLGHSASTAAPVVTGRVLLRVLIDAEGVVDEVTVVEAEPAGVFEEQARAAFLAARFRPALKNGRPVKSRLLVDVDYGESASATR